MSKEAKRSKIRRAFDKIVDYSPARTVVRRNGSRELYLAHNTSVVSVVPAWVILAEGGPETLTFELSIEVDNCLAYKANALSRDEIIHKVNETFAGVNV